MGTLYLVSTPIGNLEDITLRALRVLREADIIAAEDTRHTRKLLKRYEITTKLTSYHEHNKEAREEFLLDVLEGGDLAVVSDAGTPGLSDPGFELVQAALERGYEVTSIPGPSAPIAALVASGLPTDSFIFLGYLPRKASARRALIESLSNERRTLVLFEVPHRIHKTLGDLIAVLGEDRLAALGRELTKLHEEIVRGTLGEVQTHIASGKPRGEYTLVLGGAPMPGKWTESEVMEAMRARINTGLNRSSAARQIAAESGWTRQEVYRLSLEEK
jgi:16S rRNA (cytidine1402-2'-O)-methyltransferase